jgi:hypothetical protein
LAGIAAVDNTVHIVWNDATPGNLDVFYIRSADGGMSFEATQNRSKNTGVSELPTVAVSGSIVLGGNAHSDEIGKLVEAATDGWIELPALLLRLSPIITLQNFRKTIQTMIISI